MTEPQRLIALPAFAGLALSVTAVAQSSNGGERQEPTFDVVSIRRSADQGPIGTQRRPDGLVMTRVLVNSLLQQAFPSAPYRIGLPEWAQTERYDVTAKSRPGASDDERAAMVRALLADRFKLLAHVEDREHPVYELAVFNSPPGDPPSIYTAVQEQLGLKLVPTTVPRPTLVIDRLERPTPN